MIIETKSELYMLGLSEQAEKKEVSSIVKSLRSFQPMRQTDSAYLSRFVIEAFKEYDTLQSRLGPWISRLILDLALSGTSGDRTRL